MRVHDTRVDLALQPLDGLTKVPTGSPWNVTDVPIAADGSFTADFGTQSVPPRRIPS